MEKNDFMSMSICWFYQRKVVSSTGLFKFAFNIKIKLFRRHETLYFKESYSSEDEEWTKFMVILFLIKFNNLFLQ